MSRLVARIRQATQTMTDCMDGLSALSFLGNRLKTKLWARRWIAPSVHLVLRPAVGHALPVELKESGNASVGENEEENIEREAGGEDLVSVRDGLSRGETGLEALFIREPLCKGLGIECCPTLELATDNPLNFEQAPLELWPV